MTLSEKILYCRKKAMLSQETLAERLGVSRQAISKWETGESVPEVSNLSALATALGVSVDWLLSSDEPVETPVRESHGDWIDRLPGTIGKLFRRFGWLIGVIVAVWGAVLAAMGLYMRQMLTLMYGDALAADPSWIEFVQNGPGYRIGTVLLAIGIVLVIVGVAGSLFLKIYFKKQHNNKK